MELEFALLAEAASAGEHAQVHLIGGGFDSIAVQGLPAAGQLALVARFSAGIDDFEDKHRVSFVLVKPDGAEIILGELANSVFPPPVEPTRRSHLTTVVKATLKLESTGKYQININADGHLMKALPLFVVQKEDGGEA